MDTERPWQQSPSEITGLALNHLQKDTGFDQRIAFLLLDIGVETTMKTFLLLSEKATGTKMAFGKRKAATEGSFHDLCDCVEKAASTRLKGVDLSEVEYFHNVRNKLYHQGDGVTVAPENTRKYATLAVDILNRLLEVNLSTQLESPVQEIQDLAIHTPETLEIRLLQKQIEAQRQTLREEIRVLVAHAHFPFATDAFAKDYEKWYAITNKAIEKYRITTDLPELPWPYGSDVQYGSDLDDGERRKLKSFYQDAWDHDVFAESRKFIPYALQEWLSHYSWPECDALIYIGPTSDVLYFQISTHWDENDENIALELWPAVHHAELFCKDNPATASFSWLIGTESVQDRHASIVDRAQTISKNLGLIYAELVKQTTVDY